VLVGGGSFFFPKLNTIPCVSSRSYYNMQA
jgi:hypothetical protein